MVPLYLTPGWRDTIFSSGPVFCPAAAGFRSGDRARAGQWGPPQNALLRGNARFPAAADLIGERAIINLALDEGAGSFYERFGLRAFSDSEPLMLLLRMADLRAVFEG